MLRPAELGSVRLDLTVKGNSLEATLTAQNEAAVEALRENLSELRSRLEEFGMEIERIEIRKADPSSLTQENSDGSRNQGSGYQGSGSQNSSGSFHDPDNSRESRGFAERNNRHSRVSSDKLVQPSSGRPHLVPARNTSSLDLML
jgi:flagellar hook-length control protein FliK